MIGAGDSIKHLLVHGEDFRSGGLHGIQVLLVNITMACRYSSYIYYEVPPGLLSSRATGRELPRGSCLEKPPRITGAENLTT